MTGTDTVKLQPRDPIPADWLLVYVAAVGVDAPSLGNGEVTEGSLGPAGWGWAASDGRTSQGYDLNTTTGRATLTAVLDAMDCLDEELMFIADNHYAYCAFKHGWWYDWKEAGWVYTDGSPTQNSDLWKPVICEMYEGRTDFRWAIEYPGNPDLAIADQLAAADELEFAKKLALEAMDRATDLI